MFNRNLIHKKMTRNYYDIYCCLNIAVGAEKRVNSKHFRVSFTLDISFETPVIMDVFSAGIRSRN